MQDNQIDRYLWTKASASRLISARGTLSRYELSKRLRTKLGCFGENEISKFERRQKQTIKTKLLVLICEELDTTVDYIIYGENSNGIR
jgi:DNA-binding Xre family transcriptional regulator